MEDVRAFKNELKNYRYYQKKLKAVKEEIDTIYYNLSGLASKPFGASAGSTNQEIKEERRLEAFNTIEMLEDKASTYTQAIQRIESTLNACDSDIRDAIIKIYCDGHTYSSMAVHTYYSPRGLEKRIDKEIKKALKEKIPAQ